MTPVSLAALIVAVLALVVAVIALWQLRRMTRRYRVLWGEGPEHHGDVAQVLARQDAVIAGAVTRIDDAGTALKHVALVRYDAFGDIAGRLSFSAALVDDLGNGLVISSIHARSESRTYAKSIERGAGSDELTPEEKQAVAAAVAGNENA